MNIVVLTGSLTKKTVKRTRYGIMFIGVVSQMKPVKDGKGGIEYVPQMFSIKAYNVQAEILHTTIEVPEMVTIYGELESVERVDSQGKSNIYSFVLVHNVHKVLTLDKMTIVDQMAMAEMKMVANTTAFGRKFGKTLKLNSFMRKQDGK